MEERKLTGYPSIDKPWLKYFSEEAINTSTPECTIYEYLWEKNKTHLDDTALIYFNRNISYGDLFRYIDKTAAAFSLLGVKEGEIVTIALPNIPESIYCIYALNKLGAVADMVDLRAKGDTLSYYLKESKARYAVICDLFLSNLDTLPDSVKIEKWIIASPFDSFPPLIEKVLKAKNKIGSMPDNAVLWKQFIKASLQSTDAREICGSAYSTACIFHTSGTTGFPKGVMMTNHNFNAMALQVALSGLRFDYGQRIMNQVPPFLAFNTLCSMHLPLAQHMVMVLLPEYCPERFAENIVKTKATCCLAGPADWGNFLADSKTAKRNVDLSGLVNPISGSDAMSKKAKAEVNELLRSKGCTQCILEGYGMTEIGSAACANLPQFNNDNSVGIPLPFNTFCIYDNENDCELPYGQSGEICMTGPTVMPGYFNNPEETANVLRKHADGLTWLHSGDLGHMDENGCVYIDGRLKRVIVRYDGIKVYPFNTEKVIMKHNNVFDCCVVGAPDTEHGFGSKPVAYVALKENNANIIEDLRALCISELAENYRPAEFIIVDKLPLTPNGKVDYRSLEVKAKENYKAQ